MNLRLRTSLLAAVGGAQIALLVLAGILWQTVHTHDRQRERTHAAHEVVHAYYALSNNAYQKLSALGAMLSNLQSVEWSSVRIDAEDLRVRLHELHGAVDSDGHRAPTGPEHLHSNIEELERVVHKIVLGARTIEQAISRGDIDVARRTLGHLRGSEVAGQLDKVANAGLRVELAAAQSADSDAEQLSNRVAAALPFAVGATIVTAMLFAGLVTRRLNAALGELRAGAERFRAGKFQHRIRITGDLEFQRLAETFNQMAHDLAYHRSELEGSNEQLERTIARRTRALEVSKERLSDADNSRRRLLADLSHELRTPLTIIRGEADFVLRAEQRTAAEYRDCLDRVIEQADHTTRLIDDLLFVARADSGESRLTTMPQSLADLVSAVCDDQFDAARTKGVRVDFTDTSAQAVVDVDAARIRQVMVILLDNALRFSQKGGLIDVSVSAARGWSVVVVRDHGVGISEQDARQAFQRTQRSDDARSDGSGLGLPVAKSIVEAHRGSIELAGHDGGGAVARVSLPLVDPPIREALEQEV